MVIFINLTLYKSMIYEGHFSKNAILGQAPRGYLNKKIDLTIGPNIFDTEC